MKTTARSRLGRTGVAALFATTAALGLVACAEDDSTDDAGSTDEASPTDEAGSTESENAADDEPEGGAVDVAAIQDEGAGSDGEYDGSYDDEFLAEVNSFDGERVTITAEVNEVVSEQAFTVGGIDDPDVEPLLIIHANQVDFLEQDAPVIVTGVVHKAYSVAIAEEQLGMQLEEADFAEWGSQPYIETDTVGELALPEEQ